MIDFKHRPTYQGICEAYDGFDGAGFRTDEVHVSSSDGSPIQMAVPKELVISRDPDEVTLLSNAILLLNGEEVTVDSTTGSKQLKPEKVVEFINGIINGQINTFPPLNKSETRELIMAKEMLDLNMQQPDPLV